MNAPDFEALRSQRNTSRRAAFAKLAEEGWQVAGQCAHNDDAACYCACPEGPCEHDWTGTPFEDHEMSSATCARCGTLAYSHSLRVMP